VALEEVHLHNAIAATATFGSMSNTEAEPIFGQYIQGLTLLAKADVHLGMGNQARDAFLLALRRALLRFGDMKSEDEQLSRVMHRVMQPLIPVEEQRNQVFSDLDSPGQGSIGEAVAAKRVADLYLALVARRLWPEFVKRAVESEKRTPPLS
jgi:hypothetical protein